MDHQRGAVPRQEQVAKEKRILTRGVPSRRRFLQAVAGAAAVGLYTWRVEPHWLQIVRRPLPLRNLPARLAGRTLVQISDLHVGPRVSDAYVLDTFARVAALQPDIVVFTGDFISHHEGWAAQVRRVYEHFPLGRLATLAVLGNHDYGRTWSHGEIADGLQEIVKPLGITVLRNEVHDVHGLQFVGLDDLWAGRFHPGAPLRAVDARGASIVLSHNPDTVDLPVWENYEGWILSGHTHGGQCKPPFLPPPLLPVKNRTYTSGEFMLHGNRRLYVSRGVGHLLQVRFNVRPEVTVFELRPA